MTDTTETHRPKPTPRHVAPQSTAEHMQHPDDDCTANHCGVCCPVANSYNEGYEIGRSYTKSSNDYLRQRNDKLNQRVIVLGVVTYMLVLAVIYLVNQQRGDGA